MRKKDLSDFPELLESYHPVLNKKKIYDVERKIKVWWKCTKGHEWESSISTRSRRHNGKIIGCPYCAGLKVSKENSLLILFPKIADFWDHQKNKKNLEEVSRGNSNYHWWICKNGHSFKSTVGTLTNPNRINICPQCGGSKASKENNLKVKFPELIKEWDYNKNKSPSLYLPYSSKKVWWICKKGHSFKQNIIHRTNQKQNCPYCSNRRVSEDNNLYNYPHLIKEWDWDKNKTQNPKNIIQGSNKRYWWKCKKGHSWKTKVRYRTYNNTDCPICAGFKKSTDYDELVSRYLKLQKNEWNWEKNGDLDPNTFKAGSQKKVWWICQNKHEWQATIGSRTGRGANCPKCSNQTSKPEMRIISELEHIFENVKSRIKIKSKEVDIYIEDIKLGIEFDGYFYHQDSYKKDKLKSEFFAHEKIKFMRIRSYPLKKVKDQDVIIKRKSDILTKSDINKIFVSLIHFCKKDIIEKINNYLKVKEFKNDDLYRKYLSFYPSPLPQHSLKIKFPDIAKEWDFNKNYPLRPQNFYPGTQSRVWWICQKNHSYDMPVAWRTSQNQSCPFCAGKRLNKKSNFAFYYPNFVKEWNWKKNKKLKPQNFSKRSGKLVWWKCKNGHEWKQTIHDRTNPKKITICPSCNKNNKLLVNRYPMIAYQWHKTKNGNYNVQDFTYGSKFNAWWFCDKCNKEWQSTINSRTNNKTNKCDCKKN